MGAIGALKGGCRISDGHIKPCQGCGACEDQPPAVLYVVARLRAVFTLSKSMDPYG